LRFIVLAPASQGAKCAQQFVRAIGVAHL
jgi:hypothetical protein